MSALKDWKSKLIDRYYQKGYYKKLTLWDHFENWCMMYNNSIAISEDDKEISYEHLMEWSVNLSFWLEEIGVKKGDRVIVQLPNSINFIVVIFSLFRIGAIPVLCNINNKEFELNHICSVSKPILYIASYSLLGNSINKIAQNVKNSNGTIRELIFEDKIEEFKNKIAFQKHNSISSPESSDIALLLLSGGTTGLSKLIPRTHADHYHNFSIAADFIKLNRESVYLACLPIVHNFALACPGVLGTLAKGGKVIMPNTMDLNIILELIQKHKVNITSLVPPLLSLLLDSLDYEIFDISSLKILQVGGSKLEEDLAKKVKSKMSCKLQQVYGTTEGFYCYTSLNDSEDIINTTQGKPICVDDEFLIVDLDGNAVANGVEGELIFRGPCTIFNYYGNLENREHSFSKNGYYYNSGDKAKLDKDGNIIIVGRIKEQVVKAGENISVAELESLIFSMDGVEDVAVVGVEDELLGEKICIFLLSEKKFLTLKDIRKFFHENNISINKFPDQLEYISKWPLTNIGKIDKKKLADIALKNK